MKLILTIDTTSGELVEDLAEFHVIGSFQNEPAQPVDLLAFTVNFISVVTEEEEVSCQEGTSIEFLDKQAYETQFELVVNAAEEDILEISWPDTLTTAVGDSCVTSVETEVSYTGG